ncbi:MAG: methyltransferase domain-containing protein [Chlorobium sp.]|nr:MAG: methyltransferase domain-containing protein [Chlorobium sp.]
MLQLKTAGFKALGNLRPSGNFLAGFLNMDDLNRKADEAVAHFLDERFAASQELGGVFLLLELLDTAIRTSDKELMDKPNLPESEKLDMVQALDRQNVMMQLYPRYIDTLLPLITEVAEHTKREVRVLELASGAGGLAFALAETAEQKNLNVRITASDIVPAFIEEGNGIAAEKKLAVSFRLLNAFSMNELEMGEFDIVVMAQSLHHFTPGQLAVIIAQSARYATTAFVGIDGYRSMLLTGGVPLIASLQGIGSFTLDGLTSARKFYSELELDMIAELATGRREHTLECLWPFSVLTVRF